MSIATRGGKRGVSGWTRPEAIFYVVAAVAILIGAVDLVDYVGATMAVTSAVNGAAQSAATGGTRAIAAGDIVKAVVGAGSLDPCGIGQIDIYGPTGVCGSAPPMVRDRYIFSHCAAPGAVAVPTPNTLLYSPDAGASAASVTVRMLYRYHPPISLFGLDDTLVLAGRASQAVGSSVAIGAAPTPAPVSGALAISVCGALPPAPVIRQVVGVGQRDTLSWAPGAPGVSGTVSAPASGGWTIIQYRIDPLIAEQTVLQVTHVPAGQTTMTVDDVSGQRVAYGVAGLNSCGVLGQQSALVDDGRVQPVSPAPAPTLTTTPVTTTTPATAPATATTPATTPTATVPTVTATVAAGTTTAGTTTVGTTTVGTTTAGTTTVGTTTAGTTTVGTTTVGTTTTATVTVGVTTTATVTVGVTTTATAMATAATVQPASPGSLLVPTACAGVPMAPVVQRVVSMGQEDTVTWLAAPSGPAASGGWTVARYHIDPLIAERTVLGIAHVPAGQTTANFAVPPGQHVSYGVSGINSCGVPGPESALATDGR